MATVWHLQMALKLIRSAGNMLNAVQIDMNGTGCHHKHALMIGPGHT